MNIITSDLKNLYKSFIDELLRENSLSLPCKLLYDSSSFTECANCIVDPVSHRSSNMYKSGGPLSFADGQICPYCRGLGGVYSEGSDILNLLVLFDYKSWINFNAKINSPDGLVQTISKLADYPKIKSCNKIIIDTNISNYTQNYFQRNSDPEPCGFGESSYFFTFWKKI
jgi:hypothetical protein